jgi:hypothetical protein
MMNKVLLMIASPHSYSVYISVVLYLLFQSACLLASFLWNSTSSIVDFTLNTNDKLSSINYGLTDCLQRNRPNGNTC